jgi:hypothetical protein
MVIQSRQQARKDRMRMIVDLAIQDQKIAWEALQLHPGRGLLYPLAMYLHHNAEVSGILEKRSLTAADLERIAGETQQLATAVERASSKTTPKS